MGSATFTSMNSVQGVNYDETVNEFNGIPDQNWGEGGIHVYLCRCLFRRVRCNIYHWGIIIGSYESNFIGSAYLQKDQYMSINWSSVGLKVDMGMTFEEAKQKILSYSSQGEDNYYMEERDSLRENQYFINDNGCTFEYQDMGKVSYEMLFEALK